MYHWWNALLFLVVDARERTPWSEAIAAQIRAERAAADLTQAELARRAGMPRISYLRVENGSRVADISQVKRIADGLGMSVIELVMRAEQRLGGSDSVP